MQFDWDAENIDHLARHDIMPMEAEEVIEIDSVDYELQQDETEDRVLCLGRTAAGRLLAVVYTERGEAIRVITAYPMAKWQERIYFEDK